MASITASVLEDLASQIRAQQQQLLRILELGLRELSADAQAGFDGAADVLEDREDWDKYEYLEHLVRMAKAAAHVKLAPSQTNVRY